MLWFVVDQWSKLLIVVFSMLMAVLTAALNRFRSKVTIVLLWIAGVFYTVFFAYHRGQLIYGTYLFRSLVQPIIDLGYNCDNRVKPLMWSLIVLSFLLIVVIIVLSFIRSDNSDLFNQHNFRNQEIRKHRARNMRASNMQSAAERKMFRTTYR